MVDERLAALLKKRWEIRREQSNMTPTERGTANARRYRTRYPERLAAYRKKNRDYNRNFNLKKFGLTLSQYNELLTKQNYRCAVCGHLPEGTDSFRKGKNLAVDHNHETGKVRGLLCDLCNRGLGQLRDNPFLLIKAVAYLNNASL